MYAMRQGFLDLFDAEYHLVVRFMMRNGAGLAEAEDAAREAFTRGWQKVARDQWSEVTHPRAWIRTVALNHHRGQRRDVAADPPETAEPGPGHAEPTGQALDVVTALSLIDDETARSGHPAKPRTRSWTPPWPPETSSRWTTSADTPDRTVP